MRDELTLSFVVTTASCQSVLLPAAESLSHRLVICSSVKIFASSISA